MRNLARIETILNIESIPNADAIEVATVQGWKVVVKKDEFKIGDKVIYIEIDSFLPIKPEYEFLRSSSYKKMVDLEGFRIKTIKLRGQISQGLILPFSPLINNCSEGEDISELLGIIKYEPPISAQLAGDAKGLFPSFIPKSDEERIQNLRGKYDSFRNEVFYATEKLEGSSMTVYYKDGDVGVCSRNLDLKESVNNTFWKTAYKYDLINKLQRYNRNIAIQGELIGEGIQGNIYKLNGHQFRVFNVFNIDNGKYCKFDEMIDTIDDLELERVPIINSYKPLPTIKELIENADGKSQLNPAVNREGLVFRTNDRSVSFKVISNNYLLKQKD